MDPRPFPTVRFVAGIAIVAGLAETFLAFAGQPFAHTIPTVRPHAVWLIPAVNAVVYGAVLLALLVVQRLVPPTRSLRVTLVVFLSLALLSLGLRQHSVSGLAVLILAVGVSARAAALLASRAEGLGRLIRRTVPALVALVVLAAVGISARRVYLERRVAASLPEPPAGAPNVLLIIWDTVRSASLSTYGYGQPTSPHLSRLAARGVTFDRAMAPAPYTLASHASFFTGHWPLQTSITWRKPLDRALPTLAEVLGRRGWLTGGFSANAIYVSRMTGLARGFARFDGRRPSVGEAIRSSALATRLARISWLRILTNQYDLLGRKSATVNNTALLRWIDDHPAKPFFAFVNYFDAHSPYLPRAPYDTMFGGHRLTTRTERERMGREQHDLSDADAATRQPAYDGAIAGLDEDVGALFDSLQARGVLHNTLVIVSSDHGEEFGERGFYGHGFTLFLPSLQVPLVVAWPGHTPMGMHIPATVSLRDLPATITALLGLADSTTFPGRSLARFWTGFDTVPGPVLAEVDREPNSSPQAPVTHADLFSLIEGPWQVIRNGDQPATLYDLEEGPAGREVTEPAADTTRTRLAGALQQLIAGHHRWP